MSIRHPEYRYVIQSCDGKAKPRVMTIDAALDEVTNGARHDVHRSIARYDESLAAYQREHGHIRNFRGPCYADYLLFEIDREGPLTEALADARRLAITLHDHYDVREDQVRYFVSGSKGLHLSAPMQLCGDVEPSTHTCAVLRRMALAIAEYADGVGLDLGVYRRLGMIRVAGTQHPARPPAGQGFRWKTELTWTEFSTWTVDQVLELAMTDPPRELAFKPHDIEPIDALVELHAKCLIDAEEYASRPRPEPVRARGEPINVEAVAGAVRPFYVEGRRHDVSLWLSGYLARQGVGQDQAEAVVGSIAASDDDNGEASIGRVRYTYEAVAEGTEVRGYTGLGEILSEDALRELAGLVEPTGNGKHDAAAGGESVTRPTIRLTADLVHVIDQALNAITARPELNIFVRGRMLVTIERDGSMPETWLRRPPGEPVIVPIKTTYTREILARCAGWESVKKGKDGPTIEPCMPPMWVADHVLARMRWPLRYLDAVVEAPTIRADGSILSTPGWDEQSTLLYAPVPSVRWPTVPDSPSADDVQRAVTALTDPVIDFPFVADGDRAAFVAAVLTIVARHCIDGPVPLFPVRAPTPGTGKTLLAEVIGLIGTGRVPAAMTLPYDGDELRKRITSIAIGGTPLVLIDNASGALGSDVLAAALTAGEWEDRALGVNEMVRVPLRTVWIATGNNLAFQRTLGRRVVPVDLDAEIEQPEDREGFQYPSLIAHVRSQRPELVVAALTILRGFFAAGRPTHGGTRMGSFEAWDDLIRSAAIWAGLADPASAEDPQSGRGRVRAEADDDAEDLAGLLTALDHVFERGVGFTTAAVLKRAEHDEDLRLTLNASCAPKRGGRATIASVGAWFRTYKNRPLNGLSLQRKDRTWFIHADTRRAA